MTRKNSTGMELIKSWGTKNGPLPNPLLGSHAAAFWRAYNLGPQQGGLRGGSRGSVADTAFRAGLRRRDVEPGLFHSGQEG